MCGIAGYVGKNNATEFLMKTLERLQYRGYDSAGIGVMSDNKISLCKCKGDILNLKDKLQNMNIKAKIGIGHTRWATHGKPDEKNCHPHLSVDGHFAVVHNGIIENYLEIKNMLIENGFSFVSETDSEVIPNLLQFFFENDVFEALVKTTQVLRGSYAIGVISTHQPEILFAVAKDSPLIVGVGKTENFICSDIPALLSLTKNMYVLNENEFALVAENSITIADKTKSILSKQLQPINHGIDEIDKAGYEFFMLKEIMEQPKAINDTIAPRIIEGKICFKELENDFFRDVENIQIVACGSAYNAGLAGGFYIEKLARIKVSTSIASEFRYNNPIVGEKDVLIAISQSGETSDTLAAVRYAKEMGIKTLAVTNVSDSSLARECDRVIYTYAGTEIAVATTKGYITQVYVLILLSLLLSKNYAYEHIRKLIKSVNAVEKILLKSDEINELATKFSEAEKMFFIGRGIDSIISVEGSLKLKEISYIHSQSYPAGELKHGTLALIEDGIPVIAVCTQRKLMKKMLSNIKEVKARGGVVIAVALETMNELIGEADYAILIPDEGEDISPILAVVILQIFAYCVARHKKIDVDKPRNLAKSVTVE